MTTPNLPRFHGYAALFVFSIVTLIAMTESMEGDKNDDEKWVLSVVSISLALSFFAAAAHFLEATKKIFVGKIMEYVLLTLLVGIWAGGLPVIMDPENGIAIIDNYFIVVPNIYFGSWICFGLVMVNCANLFQETFGKDNARQTSPKTAKWYALMACSFVMMASSIRIHRSSKCDENGNGFYDNYDYDDAFYGTDVSGNGFYGSDACDRNKYAISLGVLGLCIGLVMAIVTARGLIAILYETIVSIVTLILFCFGVAYITFGDGPGVLIGNLYFSSWLAFITSVSLTVDCAREYWSSFSEGEGEPDIRVEETVEETTKDVEGAEPAPEGPTEGTEVKA